MRKWFDIACEELHKLVLHGVTHSATLLVTFKGVMHAFKTTEEAHMFVKRVQEDLSCRRLSDCNLTNGHVTHLVFLDN